MLNDGDALQRAILIAVSALSVREAQLPQHIMDLCARKAATVSRSDTRLRGLRRRGNADRTPLGRQDL
jgi:hypothetical protein